MMNWLQEMEEENRSLKERIKELEQEKTERATVALSHEATIAEMAHELREGLAEIEARIQKLQETLEQAECHCAETAEYQQPGRCYRCATLSARGKVTPAGLVLLGLAEEREAPDGE